MSEHLSRKNFLLQKVGKDFNQGRRFRFVTLSQEFPKRFCYGAGA
jgi:hypothetical protein